LATTASAPTGERFKEPERSLIRCKIWKIHGTLSDFAVHLTAGIIGEAESILSRTRAALAPAKPVLRILDRIDPLAKLAAKK
jgi:hypothetical protein